MFLLAIILNLFYLYINRVIKIYFHPLNFANI